MYIRFIKVQYYIFYRYILQWYSNKLVKWHVELTPSHSTEDSLTEILLEQLRYKQRKVEQKRWSIWLKILQLSKEMGNPDPIKEIPPVILETEDSMHDKAAENETF
jgi:hypothetical protein